MSTTHRKRSPNGPADDVHGNRETRMGRAFVELAVAAVDDADAVAVSSALLGVSLDLLPCDAAGLTLGDTEQDLRLAATSNPDVEAIGLLGLYGGEGPGLDCYRGAAPVLVADLAADGRWPRFSAAAADTGGVASVHALPLHRRGRMLGVLTLFDATPGPLSGLDLGLGQALADTATVAILRDREIRRVQRVAADLQAALDGRVVVEQATGFVAGHHGVDVETAFGLLRDQARVLRLQVSEIARLVVAGDVDPDGRPGPPGG